MPRPFQALDLLDIPEFVERCQRNDRPAVIDRWLQATYGDRTPSRATIERAWHTARRGGSVAPSLPVVPVSVGETPTEPYKLVEAATGATVESPVAGRIISLDDLLTAAKVDLVAWRVDRFVVNKWEVGTKGPDGNTVVAPLFQVKAWLLPNVEAVNLVTLKDDMLQEMAAHAPRYAPAIYPPRTTKERYLLEVSPFDLHVGKLGWGAETDSEHYDSKIAERLLLSAIEDLVSKASGFQPERILFPIGNDLLHTDNPDNLTTAGTRQDADGRHKKMFRTACRLMVAAIDRLTLVAPVDVVVVPGNHDRDSAFKLGEVLAAWYRNCDNVTIDNAPTLRKYFTYGVNLIGFTHGSEEKHSDLPLLMAQERPREWGEAKVKAWHLGHYHKRKQTNYTAGDTFNGVTVTVLPSLSGTDSWHYARGYSKGQRAAEAHLWGMESGHVGHFSSNYFEGAV